MIKNIRIIGDNPRIDFGLSRFKKAPDEKILVLNLDSETAQSKNNFPILPEQSYNLSKQENGWVLVGDSAGCMYGLIDIADAISAGKPLPEGVHQPYIQVRGIKMNIPLDARTPSYSDAGDSAWNNIKHVWEMDFWTSYLDALAENKYNALSIWNLHPFPSMVKVPGFENVALNDVKQTKSTVTGASLTGIGMYGKKFSKNLKTIVEITIEEKIEFWRNVMQYAHDRNIAFYIFTWNVFIYGTEGSGYGITGSLDNPITKLYFRKSVEALIKTYPLLRGIGITAGERMSVGLVDNPNPITDVRWLAETYGQGIADAIGESGRQFRLIHRQHMSGANVILEAFKDLPIALDFSFKYSQAHMYSDTKPTFGSKFFQSLPDDYKTFLTVRNDDLYMMRWGGIEYAREYLLNMPLSKMHGFLMGPDGYTWGRDYLSKADAGSNPRRLVIDRQWLMMAIWGRLSYTPDLDESGFIALVSDRLRCDVQVAKKIIRLCETVSMVMPLINRIHWHDFDFQNYPEANCSVISDKRVAHMGGEVVFHDVHDYILAPAQPGSKFIGVREFCLMEHEGKSIPNDMTSPVTVAHQMLHIAENAEKQIEVFHSGTGELDAILQDCIGFSLLARFFSSKILAAVETQRTILNQGKSKSAQKALDHAKKAHLNWLKYSKHLDRFYFAQRLTRMNGRLVDLRKLSRQSRKDLEMVQYLVQEYE